MVAGKSNAVTFKVLQDATKPEIKAAVELMFKVEVKAFCGETKGQDQAFWQDRGPPRQRAQGLVSLKPVRAEFGRGGCVIMAVIK